MIDAEKWYEYQRDYQKYGLDMKPERVKPKTRKRRVIVRPDARNRAETRKMAISAVAILGVVCIFAIMVTAFCADLRYDINDQMRTNAELQGEIENLQAQLYSSTNIGVVESTAASTMGMVYPTKKKQIYITNADVPEEGFAAVLRDKAYN
ncbi:MAG: hypothetical protein KBS66_08040 [Eubacterium sp.]|nr:hypothetical protein [Candidatus Colimonas fimequi]